MSRVWKFLKRFLLVVVIALVAWIAYSYLHRKITGPPVQQVNLSDMRSLNTALNTYSKAYGHYPDSLGQLGMPKRGPDSAEAAGLLGSKLVSGHAHGFVYTYTRTANGYEIHGDPEGSETNVHLFTDQSAEVRMERKKPAGRDSGIAE